MSTALHQRPSVEIELSNLATGLLEAFSALDADVEQQLDAHQLLRSYIRSVTRCGLAAGRAGSTQLQDHCVLFQGKLKTLLAQPDEVVTTYQHVLEQWPLLLMSFIDSEQDDAFAQQLDDLLTHTPWPDESPPLASVVPEPTPTRPDTADAIPAPPAENEAPPQAETESPETLAAQGAYPELVTEFEEAMHDLLALDSASDPATCQQTITDGADRLELFAISAAAAGLFGLMDIAQLLHSSLRARAPQLSDDNTDWSPLHALHKAILTYLQSSVPAEHTEHLLTVLRQCIDPDALDASELSALSALLDETTHAPMVSADTETEPDANHALPAEPSEPTLSEESHADTAEAKPEPDPSSLTPQAQELLQLIAGEFEPLSAELAAHMQALLETTADSEAHQAAENYAAALLRFVEVFDSIGLNGLGRLFSLVADYVQHLPATRHDDIDGQFWLAEWPGHVLNYLANPYIHAEALIQHCQANATPLQWDETARQALFTALRAPRIDSGEDEAVPRQTVAEADDVSLQLPEDVNPQLLDSLLQELPQQTAEFSRVITSIVQGQGNLQDIETAQRVAHTLKGSANTVGVAGIANLTHHIEDILLAFTRQKALPQAPLTTTLQDAADVLEMMSEALLGMAPAPAQQALTILQQILDWANQIDLNGLPEASQPVAHETPAPGDVETVTNSSPAHDNSLRISTQSVDETLRLIGEATIVNAQLEESLRLSLAHNKSIQTQSALFQQLAFELEQLIDVRGMHSLLSGVSNSAFDALEMDQYNELHTLTRRMVEAATDARTLTQYAEDELKNLDALLHQQKRHTKDTQDVVMKTRMLPVQTIVPRLQRSIRQTCRLTGKQAELSISGVNTLVDNDILAMLADPLMHILRNAVDHGIEAAELREQSGKPSEGHIRLDFSREGEYIVIRCRDDGAGLDLDAIKRVAVDKGVVQPDEILSTESLTRLIFVSGLSTREETTQMSGRGIGMDAVYNQVTNMKGSIRVLSEPQAGVLVEIQLPATLVTLHGILVRVHDQVLAIANRGVEQILYADDGVITENDHKLSYRYKDETYPAYFLEDLLGLARPDLPLEELKRPAMLLDTGDGNKVSVLIERILNTQDVVIKKLGQYAPSLIGVEGVTILGDGSVAAVVDLNTVILNRQGDMLVPRIQSNDDGIQSGSPKVLVVDDSLSARNSLAEFMHDSGYRVCTARDGMDAIEQLDSETPDILLVDMEMPRMNGLELAAYVRANKATQNLPIIMITSRATDKHREEARKAGVNAYLTKPYSESEVLDQIATQLASAFTQSFNDSSTGVNV